MLSRLRTSVTVAELKSFSRAGKVLNLSQPAVSKQVAALEAHYGVRVLRRDGSRLQLTTEGMVVYRHALNVLAAESALRDELATLSARARAAVRLGASSIPAQFMLPRLLKPLLDTNPWLNLTVSSADTGTIRELLLEGRFDLAILGAPVDAAGVVNTQLVRDELVLVVPAGHPFAARAEVELGEVVGQPLVWRGPGSATRAVVEGYLGAEVVRGLKNMVELGSTEAVVRAVAAGIGLAFVSRWAVGRAAPHALPTVKLSGLHMERWIYACYPSPTPKQQAIEAIIEFLKTQAPAVLNGSGA